MAPTNIARVINAWLYLVPDELRAADASRDTGYDQYVKNAQMQVSITEEINCYGARPREVGKGLVNRNWTLSTFGKHYKMVLFHYGI